MDQLLILFIAIPMLAFFATLLWQNKSEKAIGSIVRIAKVSNILIALSFFVWWLVNGLTQSVIKWQHFMKLTILFLPFSCIMMK